MRAIAVSSLLLLCSVRAAAEPITLRIATVAPAGTSWARELSAWVRDLADATHDNVHVKIYFGGIAGSEDESLARIRRDQLDGALGSEICTELAPSLKVARVIGVFQSREENSFVLSRLRPIVDKEFLSAGFINLGEAGLGPEVLFSREPVDSMDALRRLRWWVWDADHELPLQARALGINVVLTTLGHAAQAYEDRQFDGFITIPTAALAFQWTTQVRYLTPLRISFRSGCLILSTRSFDALPGEAQMAMKSVAGKLNQRIEELGRREDRLLLGGLLAKQGLKPMQESGSLRSAFFDAARAARPGARIVADDLMQKVLSWLADYRAEHPEQ